MTESLNIVPLGLFIALSPLPIVAILLLLTGRRPLANGLALCLGWIGAILLVSGIGVLVFAGRDFERESSASTGAAALELLAGVVLLTIAVRTARQPRDAPAAPPRWLDRLSGLTPWTALSAGAGLFLLNIGDDFAALAATANILQAELTTAQNWLALGVFTLTASLSILLPLGAYAIAPERSAHALDSGKRWLSAPRNTTVALCALMGGYLLLGGIRGLRG